MTTPIRAALCLAILFGGIACTPALAAPAQASGQFGSERASKAARSVAGSVVAKRNNEGLPFVIVDKVQAKVFVFHQDGRLRGASPVLVGSAIGDDSAPGIGQRSLADIRPEERTTPAGRFVASLGNDLGEKDVVWVDYEAAISLHRMVTGNARERRARRMATVSPGDNRISFGCINVPAKFYDTVVQPAFTGTNGIVYILPEVRSIESVFAFAEQGRKARGHSAGQNPP
ncbi:MAG: L,D-transpeptidase [Caulobacteraceae bacterium]|nr:L,D-transpeptidase [Caulobacteraceae bacterium]